MIPGDSPESSVANSERATVWRCSVDGHTRFIGKRWAEEGADEGPARTGAHATRTDGAGVDG